MSRDYREYVGDLSEVGRDIVGNVQRLSVIYLETVENISKGLRSFQLLKRVIIKEILDTLFSSTSVDTLSNSG